MTTLPDAAARCRTPLPALPVPLPSPSRPLRLPPVEAYLRELRPLLEAESAAESPAAGVDAEELEQGVRLRLLEHCADGSPPPVDPAAWVRRAVRAEARYWRRRALWEVPLREDPAEAYAPGPEDAAVRGSQRERLRAVLNRLPGRCPAIVGALWSAQDRTYREVAAALGLAQGSLGPGRSRCLGCLRRLLVTRPDEAAGRSVPHASGRGGRKEKAPGAREVGDEWF